MIYTKVDSYELNANRNMFCFTEVQLGLQILCRKTAEFESDVVASQFIMQSFFVK